jgi:prepilin-type N-terminal cleavage/methylation domain-containing protein/prepilin-type processing-associated H-X9-DG protein
MNTKRHAFTLVELLVVVLIIGLLMAILLPSLGRVQASARAAKCLTNLRGIGQGLALYDSQNHGFAVPSYNMPNPGTYEGQPGDKIDGWATILDRDGLVPGSKGLTNNIFYCPDTATVDGLDAGQTAYDENKPQGYQDWPVQFVTAGGDSAQKTAPTLPIAGFGDQYGTFMQEIRCGYWLNAYNPIGTAPPAGTTVPACTAYTQSVGFGPYADGNLKGCLTSSVTRPGAFIVACDGMYMGRQSVVRLGEDNRRVGYRHFGPAVLAKVNGVNTWFNKTMTNTLFGDGHAQPVFNNDFPHSNVPAENAGSLTILSND